MPLKKVVASLKEEVGEEADKANRRQQKGINLKTAELGSGLLVSSE